MPFDRDALCSRFSLKDASSCIKARMEFDRLHPYYFYPDGLLLFTGAQGKGKTLSAARYVNNLVKKYPKAIIVSNIELRLPNYRNDLIPYTGIDDIDTYSNGEYGVILFLDEIQVEFASMESRQMPPSILQKVSQQRKRRLHIVGTTQLFSRVAKPFREQTNAVVDCNCWFKLIQINSIVDFDSITEDINGNMTEYKYRGRKFFFRSAAMFDYYDTFSLVTRRRE